MGVPHFAANHSESNFAEPDSFLPERWLENRDAKFGGDVRAVVQPFSAGPRNCIGQNLALSEMRIVLAKLIWHFDMELAEPDIDWLRVQHVYGLWDKEPLLVKLKPL